MEPQHAALKQLKAAVSVLAVCQLLTLAILGVVCVNSFGRADHVTASPRHASVRRLKQAVVDEPSSLGGEYGAGRKLLAPVEYQRRNPALDCFTFNGEILVINCPTALRPSYAANNFTNPYDPTGQVALALEDLAANGTTWALWYGGNVQTAANLEVHNVVVTGDLDVAGDFDVKGTSTTSTLSVAGTAAGPALTVVTGGKGAVSVVGPSAFTANGQAVVTVTALPPLLPPGKAGDALVVNGRSLLDNVWIDAPDSQVGLTVMGDNTAPVTEAVYVDGNVRIGTKAPGKGRTLTLWGNALFGNPVEGGNALTAWGSVDVKGPLNAAFLKVWTNAVVVGNLEVWKSCIGRMFAWYIKGGHNKPFSTPAGIQAI